jgi:hypothetical protein
MIIVCIVTMRVPFILQRTQPSILRISIYNSGTVSYNPSWTEQLKLEKIHTSQNSADMLTKGVTREKLSS